MSETAPHAMQRDSECQVQCWLIAGLDTKCGVVFVSKAETGAARRWCLKPKRRAVMRSRNRKVNNVGKVSCVGLLTLGLMLVGPVSHSSAFAEEAKDSSNASATEDYGIGTQALSMSTVGISFSPTTGSTSLTPITSAGQSAQINVLATVDVANSGGYSVYLKSNSQNLAGVNNPSNIIPGIAGSVTYDNLSTNTWGYAAVEGEAVPENATYKAVSTGQGDKIAENANSKIVADTKNIMLSFVAKIGDNIPADTYQSTVTMSVVSSPVQLALGDISEMQQMTSEICENTTPNATKQLKDVRDGKYYWVTKLADNKCWMTQNLALDLNTNTLPLIAITSDVENDWTPMNDDEVLYTADIADEGTILNSYTGQRSWNLGSYYIKSPNNPTSCGSKKNSLASCIDYFVALVAPVSADNNTNAHYLVGNYYQWTTATAGTGKDITEGQAEGSICPSGWKLPTAGSGGEFVALVDALGGTSSANSITDAPFYGVRGGLVWQDSYFLSDAGNGGTYWSATATNSNSHAYNLTLISSNGFRPSAYNASPRNQGYSVRCIAR